MLEDVSARIATARQPTASKARRGLEGVEGGLPSALRRVVPDRPAAQASQQPAAVRAVQGFVLRKARRYCARKLVPWA
jgi:hypothetical protein